MVFNSIHFLIFFPIVTILYFLIPHKYRWGLLLVASYYFYMSWNPAYITLILFSTATTFFTALHFSRKNKYRLLWLIICLLLNFGILFTYKYLGFFTMLTQSCLELLNIPTILPKFNLLLPIGISFYTLQTVAYVIDVYTGRKRPVKHFGYYALFVSFFPQLVAGPIERSKALLPQFKQEHKFNYERITSGLRLATWGMFKKVVISDRAAVIVNAIYNNPENYSGASLAIATLCFAFQIYCDFSGYSDIAIGTARVLGFDLMTNFNRPYSAKSIAEFWRRWHISLSTWFKDYVYVPLGGNRVNLAKWIFNILLVFLISGLWHGAALTFIVWGVLHGIWQIFGRLLKPIRDKIPLKTPIISWLITFVFVNLTWVFFRANSFDNALYILNQIFTNWDFSWLDLFANGKLLILAIAIIVMEVVQLGVEKQKSFSKVNPVLRWGCYYSLLLAIFLFAQYGSQEFIYFQF